MFFIIEKSEENTLIFHKIHIIWKHKRIGSRKWYVLGSQTAKYKYKRYNSIKSETESIKSCLRDFSDAFILVTGDITVTVDNNTDVVCIKTTTFFKRRVLIIQSFSS